jgi:hypothetical protein
VAEVAPDGVDFGGEYFAEAPEGAALGDVYGLIGGAKAGGDFAEGEVVEIAMVDDVLLCRGQLGDSGFECIGVDAAG